MDSSIESLTARVELLTKQLNAQEEEIKKNDERMEARKAALVTAMQDMDDEAKKALRSRIRAGDDEELKKAMDDIHEEDKKHEANDDDDNDNGESKEEERYERAHTAKLEKKVRELSASLKSYENDQATIMIGELATLKAALLDNFDTEIYKHKLAAKPFSALKAMYDSRKDEIEALKASEKEPTKKHFGFGLTANQQQNQMVDFDDVLNKGGVF